MGKQFHVTIPDKFYQYGNPIKTNYCGIEDEGLSYVESPEREFELEAAFGSPGRSTVSLLSPYVLGFNFPYSASELKLVHADIEKREVIVEVI